MDNRRNQMSFNAKTALITGASSGLGEEFAKQLASQGHNLILVARSESRLNQLADRLRQSSNVQVTVIAADLGLSESVDHVIDEVNRRSIKVDLLVNNAGLGVFENFLDTTLDRQMQQINVNVRALVQLTHAFTPGMVSAGSGGVINIASNAAFQPLAGADIYAASKAFVLFFSEGLSFELAKSNVHVLGACPGPVATRFFAGMNPKLQAKQMDQPAVIVRQILHAFAKGKRVVVPGKFSVRLATLGARLLPRNLILRLAAGTVQQLNQKERKQSVVQPVSISR
jgi:short-subunit dehydrogenase